MMTIDQFRERMATGEPSGFVTPTNWNELPVLVREFIRKADHIQ